MAATSRWTLEEMDVFRAFDEMDFDTDPAFQEGLSSLGIPSDRPEEIQRAKYFYFYRWAAFFCVFTRGLMHGRYV